MVILRFNNFGPRRRAKYLFGPGGVRIEYQLPCQPFNHVQELFEFRVFVEEIIGSELPAFFLVLGERIMGVNDDFGGRPDLLDFLKDVDPVSVREADIQDGDVWSDFLDIAEGIGGIEGHSQDFQPFNL